jgi:hypothetical protein
VVSHSRTREDHCQDRRRLKTGTPKVYFKTAESGNKRPHAFCPECGTPIYSTTPEPNPTSYGLRVGGIDQRAQFAPPTRQIWVPIGAALVDGLARD